MDGMGNDLSQFSPTKKNIPQNNVAINLGKYMFMYHWSFRNEQHIISASLFMSYKYSKFRST